MSYQPPRDLSQHMNVRPADNDPAEIVPYLWSYVPYGELAFEVGANIGQSLPKMMGMFTRVIGFEPYPPTFELASKVPGADVRNVAVSDHDGEVELTLIRDQMCSPGHEIAQRTGDEYVDFGTLEKVTVPCVTLDTVMAEEGVPAFVNMDIEGHELDALHGATALLAQRRTAWLIEFHSRQQHDDCTAVLEAAGCEVETVRHPHYPRESRNWYMHGWLLAHPIQGPVTATVQRPERV